MEVITPDFGYFGWDNLIQLAGHWPTSPHGRSCRGKGFQIIWAKRLALCRIGYCKYFVFCFKLFFGHFNLLRLYVWWLVQPVTASLTLAGLPDALRRKVSLPFPFRSQIQCLILFLQRRERQTHFEFESANSRAFRP